MRPFFCLLLTSNRLHVLYKERKQLPFLLFSVPTISSFHSQNLLHQKGSGLVDLTENSGQLDVQERRHPGLACVPGLYADLIVSRTGAARRTISA